MNPTNFDPQLVTSSGCENCRGGCCRRGMILHLTHDEADQLYAAGSDMRQLAKTEWRGHKPGRGQSFYLFMADCANLDPETYRCRDYDNRPGVCREFEVGSMVCQIAAERAERLPVDLPMPALKVAM